MRLLIVTQVVDIQHPTLGFFHDWVVEFAAEWDSVEVTCLEEGQHDLPPNVTVHSLGKESDPVSAPVYAWRLLRLAWRLRATYDRVFVHMNPEYVLAGSAAWLVAGKPVSLWYTHGAVRLPLRLSAPLVTHIFTAAQAGMNLNSKKVVVTGHGIHFADVPDVARDVDLITVGRISRSKNLLALIDVLAAVRKTLSETTLTVVGAALSEEEKKYLAELKSYAVEQGVDSAITWVGGVQHAEVSRWLARARVFVHMAKNGSLDKVLLESLAAGTPVVTSAPGAASLPLGAWQVDDENFAKQVLEVVAEYPADRMHTLQEYVQAEHSLKTLVVKLGDYLKA